jgi:hypothetical protein
MRRFGLCVFVAVRVLSWLVGRTRHGYRAWV